MAGNTSTHQDRRGERSPAMFLEFLQEALDIEAVECIMEEAEAVLADDDFAELNLQYADWIGTDDE